MNITHCSRCGEALTLEEQSLTTRYTEVFAIKYCGLCTSEVSNDEDLHRLRAIFGPSAVDGRRKKEEGEKDV